MLGWPGAAEDGQPPQFVGFVVGGRVRQHMRLGVFDADHAVDAVGERLRETEQIGARVEIGAVPVVLQHVVHQLVEPLPTGLRLHGHHGGPGRDCLGHQCARRLLDEDRHRRQARLPGLPVEPAQSLVVGDAEQEENIGRARRRRQPQPHVVGVDQSRRRHRKVQAAWGIHQADQGRIQCEQQLAQPDGG